MLRTSYRLGLLWLLLLVRSAPALDAVQAPLASPLAARIDALAHDQLVQQQLVGLAVGVVQDGKIAFVRSYGLADREKQIPATPATVFNWASNSKPLAAVLAMQLVERHALDLDADVRTYVPEFPAKDSVITTRQLLCHQSGIPHYENGPVIGTEAPLVGDLPWLDPLQGLNKFNRSPLLFAPNARTSYSSYAYVLLSAVVQRAGKQPFADQLNDRIIRPLGLASLQLDVPFADQPHWAVGYTKDRSGTIKPAEEEAHYWKHGAGGFKSNIVDFARWGAALANHRLVSPETETAMWTPQKTSDGKPATFGLGFQVTGAEGYCIGHGGSQSETKTQLFVNPKARSAVVVMCNCGFGNAKAIATDIVKLLENGQSAP